MPFSRSDLDHRRAKVAWATVCLSRLPRNLQNGIFESCSFAQAHMAPPLRWGSWSPLRIFVVLLNQHIDILRTGEFTLLQVQPRASRQASETDLGLCTCSYHVPLKPGMLRIPIQSENSMVTYITHQPHGWTRSLTLCYKSRLSLS